MILQEPQVEFVAIDQNAFIQAASPCPDWRSQEPVGGGQRCYASQVDANNCPGWVDMVEWDAPENG